MRKILSIVLVLGLVSTTQAQDPVEDFMVEYVWSKFKPVDCFNPVVILGGSAEDVGLSSEELGDLLRLRLRADLPHIPLCDNLGGPFDQALIAVTFWTVGDDYPAAYHVAIGASYLENEASAILRRFVEDFAVAFMKGRGEL
jgi:hypothetical protein